MSRRFMVRCGACVVALSTALLWSAVSRCSAADKPGGADKSEGASESASEGTEDKSPAKGAATTSSSDADVIAYINQYIRRGWKDAGLTPSRPASDGEWCRRMYLDTLGRIPTSRELQAFAADHSKDRKAALVDKLLSEQYEEEFARNWTTIWTNVLIGRTGGTAQNTNISRDGMQQWLRRSFLTNKPMDQMAYELVSAQGVNKPGEDDYNGAVNYLVDNLAENATNATAKTARVFLGLQVQCTQCHNHPFNDWKQDQFWSLNSFFRQTNLAMLGNRRNGMIPSVKLEDRDFHGDAGGPGIEEAIIFYELRNGLQKTAVPKFVDGTTIDPHGSVSQVNRRTKLAELIRSSPYLPKAMVNRAWGHYMGYGFTKPVDDMGPHNPSSHPELVERLGQDFASHGFDLKQLIKWITLSEAYSLSSKMVAKNVKDDPALGERPMFSHFYLRQMRAEELYESLLSATGAAQGKGSYEEQERLKNMWLQQFSIAFGTDDGEEVTTFNGTIPQVLMMMNGELIVKATNCEPGTYLHEIATGNYKDQDKIKQLYLAALARAPSREETAAASALWQARKSEKNGDPTIGAMQDIWWALLNSNEFILNH